MKDYPLFLFTSNSNSTTNEVTMKFLWLILFIFTQFAFASTTIVSETSNSITYSVQPNSSFSISRIVSRAGHYRLIVKKSSEVSDIKGQFPYLVTVNNQKIDLLLDKVYEIPEFNPESLIIKDFRVSDDGRMHSIENDIEILIEGRTGDGGSTITLNKIFHLGTRINSSSDTLARHGYTYDAFINLLNIELYLNNIARVIHESGSARATIDEIQFDTGVYQSHNFIPKTYGFPEQEGSKFYLALLVPLGVEILEAHITDRHNEIVTLNHPVKANQFAFGTIYTVLIESSTITDVFLTLNLKTLLPANVETTFLSAAWYKCDGCGLWTDLQ